MPDPTRPADAAPAAERSLGAWARGSFWSVLDQALFAGANFLVNVLLARWLSPEAYGAFAVAFMLFLLAGTVHGGLFVEPMLVFGAGRFHNRTPAYLRVLLRGHLAYAFVTGVIFALAGLGTWLAGQAMSAEFLALSVASGFILVLWLLRRACYLLDKPSWAAGAGALYLVLLIAGAFGLLEAGWLSGPSALGLMAVGSVAASLVLAARLGVFAPEARTDEALAADVRATHAEYGRWSAPTGVLEWVSSALPLLLLPLFIGLEGSGALRALYNLAMPALQAFSALSVMALPLFVRARAEGHVRRSVTLVGGGIFGLGVGYGLTLLLVGRPVVAWLYTGKYPLSTPELLLLAAIPILSSASGVAMAWLRSEERPDAVFRARAAAVASATTVGVALTASLGVAGALASDLVALAVEFSAQARSLRHRADGTRRGASVQMSTSSGDGAAPSGRLRVLQSAFACYPNRGSEPGVGWHVATETARFHDVWVMTYAGWRDTIEAELAERPVPGLHFEYVQLPFEAARYVREGRHRTGLSEQLHYLLWQAWASRVARRLHRRIGFDVAHHVTFVKYWTPCAVDRIGIPYVWGPVGGGETAPEAFYPAMTEIGLRHERKRDIARAWSEHLPGVRRAARRASAAFATTDETAERMRVVGARDVVVRSAIGLTRLEAEALGEMPLPDDGPVRFLCLGRLMDFKGYALAVDAFAAAVASGDDSLAHAELWLAGDGPERSPLEVQAEALGIADRVTFYGMIPRAEVLYLLGLAHALVHPTLHDSGGGVCLESLAAGRPVLGFDLGGTGVHVGPECGILIPPIDPETAVRDLSDGMRRLAADPELRREMGRAGRAFVRRSFVWEEKVRDFDAVYRRLAGVPALPVVHSFHEPVPLR